MLRYCPRRWIVHAALSFGAGIFAGLYLPFTPSMAACILLSLLLTVLLRRSGRSVYAGVLLLSLFLGVLRCSVAAHPALPPAGEYTITATVSGEAQLRPEDERIAAYLDRVTLTDDAGNTCGVRRLYWTYWPEEDAEGILPPDGQQVTFRGNVYRPAGRENPHGFDFSLYLLQKGAVMGVSGAEGLEMQLRSGHRSLWLRLRCTLRERLTLLLGEDSALGTAMLLGDRSDLPEDTAESFRVSGVAHILSVSGLHVMILYALLARLIDRFSPPQWLTLLLTDALMAVYCLLVGMQAAILRACVLMTYLQLGKTLRRQADSLTGLALAFAVVLLIRPLELFAAGFQMSFAAVLGLILLGDRVRQWTAKIRSRRLRSLSRTYGVTVCASIATALPVGWYYHRLSLVGLVINPLLCALTTVLVPLLLALLALSALSLPLALPLGRLLALFSRGITHLVRFAAQAPLASVSVPRLPWYLQAAVVLCLLLCTRFVRLAYAKRLTLALSALTLSTAVLFVTLPRGVYYLQFSLGDADAAVLADGRETVVIDTGMYGGDVAAYLLSTGRSVDRLIITHLHGDHVLGLRELMQQHVKIKSICLPSEAFVLPAAEACLAVLAQAQEAGIPVQTISAGEILSTQRVRMEVLWPERGGASALADGNDFALALRIDLDGTVLLHMSDVSGIYEGYSALPADVLKCAHHGSSSSTGERFLAVVSPQIALLSDRKPSARTVQRLAEAGIIRYDTGICGAVTLRVTPQGLRVCGYKE